LGSLRIWLEYGMMRRIIHDESETLPDWSDFGKYLGNGFKELVVGLVYASPIVVVMGVV